MNRSELVTAVAEKTGITKKDIDTVVAAIIETITDALKQGDKVAFMGFGTFEVRERPERQGRNPATNEAVTIPASKAPAFKAGKALKDTVNQ